jgi:ribosomal peptide maturation radical SAM protein 1
MLPLLSLESPAQRQAISEPPVRRLRVAMVNMPWARVNAPSIQCGLLQSVVRDAGHDCDVHYLNIDLAAYLGHTMYDGIADVRAERLHLLGDWLFSYAAFGQLTSESEYFADYPEIESTWLELTGKGLDDLHAMRREVLPRWLARCVDLVNWADYDVVGFSSTFVQNTACLAMGRLLKERFPEVRFVYGGANFDGEMGPEYARTLPWLDYVVIGEGDIALPRLLAAIASGADEPIPGVHSQTSTSQQATDSPRLTALDSLPTPDYSDYFTSLAKHDREQVLGSEPVRLPVEFSRGCWWGQKHHCTFCGLNALGMGYRAKSAERALAELSGLLSDYPVVHVDAVDNILDMSYISSVCSPLADAHWDVNIFFEVKANLTRQQLSTLSKAGVLRIQPGIESLSTKVLGLMRKGSSKLLNIRLLKWARYYGISVMWNLLTGFPGESDEDYREQVELLPLLYHLEPPGGSARIWLERFSPYFTDSSFPISNVRPRGGYRHIYPDTLDHTKIAYFFDYDVDDIGSDAAHEELAEAAALWKRRWRTAKPRLIYQRLPGKLTLIDSRTSDPRRAVLTGWAADAYLACGDAPRSAAKVREQLVAGGLRVETDEVAAVLERFCRSKVMVSDEDKYLSLALPENPGW